MRRIFKMGCVAAISLTLSLLMGCTVAPPRNGTAVENAENTLSSAVAINQGIELESKQVPKAVSDALLPSVNSEFSSTDQMANHRFDVVADKMPAKVFFTGLVEGTPYNMLVNPDVTGTISLNLKHVTIEEAMDAVRDMYGYEYRKTSYGYEVLPVALETQIFTVNYLDVKRIGKSSTSISSGEVTNKVGTVSGGGSSSSTPTVNGGATTDTSVTGTVDTSSEVNFWHDLELTLKSMVGSDKERSVITNSQAGIVIVKAYPRELHEVARYLDRIQSNLQRQVILEAKIIEVTLNDNFQAGVDWSLFGNPSGAGALLSQTGNGPLHDGGIPNTNLDSFSNIFTLTYHGAFRTLINFLQTQGNTQVLSSPRISTVNNQKAVIKVGQDEFFVTGVSTSNTVVGSSTIPSQQVNLTPFFSGITLDVTPQISRDGTVILHVHPAVSVVSNQNKDINLGSNGSANGSNDLTLPLALSTIRESDNIVRAKNGQIVVIGGLMQNSMAEDTAGTPGLSKLPFVGALFRRTSQTATKTELIILLRPILVDSRVLNDAMENSNQRLHTMNRGFHAGGLPEVFGNEAE